MPNKQIKQKKMKKIIKKAIKQANPQVSGHGGYFLDKLKSAAKKAWSFLRPALGVGAKAALKHFTSSVVGHGDYYFGDTKLSELGTGAVPEFSQGTHYDIICDREYIGNVSTATTFTNHSMLINPTNSTMFPILSEIAKNYQQFSFEGLLFEVNAQSANALNSTNTALGRIIAACNYDVDQADFASQREMENYQGSRSYKPSDSFIFPVECARSETPVPLLYVDTDTNDKRLSYLGNFQWAAVGAQAASLAGELWVTYRVRLYKKRLPVTASTVDMLQISNIGATITQSNFTGFNPEIVGRGLFNGTTMVANNILRVPRRLTPGMYLYALNIAFMGASSACAYTLSPTSSDNYDNTTVRAIGPTANPYVLSQSYDPVVGNYTAYGFFEILDDTSTTGTSNTSTLTLFPGGASTFSTTASTQTSVICLKVTNVGITPSLRYFRQVDSFPSALVDTIEAVVRRLMPESDKYIEVKEPSNTPVVGSTPGDIEELPSSLSRSTLQLAKVLSSFSSR